LFGNVVSCKALSRGFPHESAQASPENNAMRCTLAFKPMSSIFFLLSNDLPAAAGSDGLWTAIVVLAHRGAMRGNVLAEEI